MRLLSRLSCCLFFCCAIFQVQADVIVVVTNQETPVYNVPEKTRIIPLDAAQQLHQQFSANLPNDQSHAAQIAKDRLNRLDQSFQQSMHIALQDALDAWSFGVAKLPAVVLNRYVVYGETDVNQAVTIIKTDQEASQ